MNNKQEIIFNNITTLSTKLGVSPDKLYAAMIRRAKAAFIVPMIQLIVMLISAKFIWIGWEYLIPYCVPKDPTAKYEWDRDWPGVIQVSSVLLGIASVANVIIIIVLAFDFIQKFIDGWINPEGAALEDLLNH